MFRFYPSELNEDEIRAFTSLWEKMGDTFFRELCTVADTGCEECKYKKLCHDLEKTSAYLKKCSETSEA